MVSALQLDIRKYIPEWWKKARCYQKGLDIFFGSDDQPSSLRRARKFCEACPVQRVCLEHALVTPEEYGIWAGTSARSRELIRSGLESGELILEDVIDKVLSSEFRWR